MTANLAHFAINADDIDAAQRFYEAVLGWRFVPWGPPDFYKIDFGGRSADPDAAAAAAGAAGSSAVAIGALQRRREFAPGTRIVGFECTFAVDDVDAVARSVVDHGGRILMEKTTIPGVGDLIWFEDPSGNPVGAMRYEAAAD
jgi:predicted enzyme related to lactoylglutathione lyase